MPTAKTQRTIFGISGAGLLLIIAVLTFLLKGGDCATEVIDDRVEAKLDPHLAETKAICGRLEKVEEECEDTADVVVEHTEIIAKVTTNQTHILEGVKALKQSDKEKTAVMTNMVKTLARIEQKVAD